MSKENLVKLIIYNTTELPMKVFSSCIDKALASNFKKDYLMEIELSDASKYLVYFYRNENDTIRISINLA